MWCSRREASLLLVLEAVYAAARMFAVLVRLISRFSWPRSGPIEVEKLNVCDNAPAMLLPSVLSLLLSSSLLLSFFHSLLLPFYRCSCSLSTRYAFRHKLERGPRAHAEYIPTAKRPRPSRRQDH